MRTSVDLPDALFNRAKKVAKQRGVTFREIVIEALRDALDKAPAPARFRLPDHAYGQQGLVEGLAESDWETIRRLAYEDRGG